LKNVRQSAKTSYAFPPSAFPVAAVHTLNSLHQHVTSASLLAVLISRLMTYFFSLSFRLHITVKCSRSDVCRLEHVNHLFIALHTALFTQNICGYTQFKTI